MNGASVAVVVCAYTDDRWDVLQHAYESLLRQTRSITEIVVVIDHNPSLLERARARFDRALVVPNERERGLSGARNTGIDATTSAQVLFLDDDAEAEAGWAAALSDVLGRADVVGVGGVAVPRWPAAGRPSWFPEPFLWVVGCSYEGLPRTEQDVRNPIGASMGFRREALALAGGFSSRIGRVGRHPVGCEETELSIRVRQADPAARVVHVPGAVVHHTVSDARVTTSYFVRRCWWEGRSKAIVSATVGRHDSLSAETGYVRSVLPRAAARGLHQLLAGDRTAAARTAALVIGLAVTVAGYVRGASEIARRRRSPKQGASGAGGPAPLVAR